jgi:hypothetical protein
MLNEAENANRRQQEEQAANATNDKDTSWLRPFKPKK